MNDKTIDILLKHRKKPTEIPKPDVNINKHLKTHKLITDVRNLQEGNVISHLKQNTNYMSRPGIIYAIDEERDLNTNKRIIKKIKLMNFYDEDHPRFWELNLMTRKYHIFSSLGVTQQFNVKKLYASTGGNLSDISSNYTSDDGSDDESENESQKIYPMKNTTDAEKYLLEEIKKYKEQNK